MLMLSNFNIGRGYIITIAGYLYDDIEIVVKWKEGEKNKLLSFLEGVMVAEDLLKRIIESQDRTEKRLIEIQDKTERRLIEIQNRTERTENQLKEIQDRTEKQFANIQNDLHTLKSDVRDIKESVHRIEEQQEETIMS
jgi:oligoendopeptidase F